MVPYLHKLKSDPTRPFALAFNILLALAFTNRLIRTPSFLFLLLACRFWMLSFFLSQRLPAEKPVLFPARALAYVSKCLPYFYQAPSVAAAPLLRAVINPISFAGALLSTWAMFNLGRRFGIAPARRGEPCRTGAYRWLRHPIYVGYAIVEVGATLLNRANIFIFIASMITLIIRARMEERILKINDNLTGS